MAKVYQSAATYAAVRQAAQKFVSNPQLTDGIATRMIHVLVFTVHVAKFIKHEIEKKYHEEAKMAKRFVK